MMKAKYSLVHLTGADCPPTELIRVAAEAGYDCVSLRSIPPRMQQGKALAVGTAYASVPFALADDRPLLLETKRAAMDAGIEIYETEGAMIADSVDIRAYERDLEAAAELGIKNLGTGIWSRDAAFYEDAFATLCDMAKVYDMNVNLEFVTWSAMQRFDDAAWFLTKMKKENQGIVLDALHFYRSKNVIRDLIGFPEAWIRSVHLSDCPRTLPETEEALIRTAMTERLLPGEGGIDLQRLVAQTPDAVRGIKVPNPVRMREMGLEAYAKTALQAAKRLLG